MHFLIIGITAFLANRQFVPAPVPMHLLCNDFYTMGLSISTRFWSQSIFPRCRIGFCCTVLFAPPCLLISWLIVEGAIDNLAAMSLMMRFTTSPLISPLFHQAKTLTGAAFARRTVATGLVDCRHDSRVKSVEHSGDIMQGITLPISVPNNHLLLWRVVNTSSSFHGNVPLD